MIDVANPIATILSTAMLFKYVFNLMEEGAMNRVAVDAFLKAEVVTVDISVKI